MKWYGWVYWWVVGGYYGIPALISILVIAIAIKNEIDENLLSISPDYWKFIRNSWAYIKGGVVFGLILLPLIIEESFFEKKGGKKI